MLRGSAVRLRDICSTPTLKLYGTLGDDEWESATPMHDKRWHGHYSIGFMLHGPVILRGYIPKEGNE